MTGPSKPTEQEVTQTENRLGATITRTEATFAESVPVDRRFAHFELLKILGTGGMGVVWQARDTRLQRIVALKMLLAGAASHPEQIDRFEVEAQAIARLEHPNIIPVYEFKSFQGQPYFAMPLISGGKLTDHKARFQADVRAAVRLVEKLAHAVAYAHERRVLHRDLKPSNILLDEQGEPCIADFGLAKLLDNQADLTLSGAVIGTPAYMSPEQALGLHAKVGPGADIWALGIILFELISGSRPFPGTSRDELTPHILNDDCRTVPFWPTVAATGLTNIILKCLEKDPDDRYVTATSLAHDLAAFLEGRPTVAGPPPAKRLSRRRVLALSVGAATVVGLGGIAAIRTLLEPRDSLSLMRRELAAQGTIQFLRPNGALRYHDVIYGEPKFGTVATEPPQLSMICNAPAMIELLPASEFQHLRLEAEFQFDPLTPDSLGGVYLYQGRWRESSRAVPLECYIRWGIDEQRQAQNPEKRREVKCDAEFIWNTLTAPTRSGSSGLRPRVRVVVDPKEPQWQRLTLELSPETVSFSVNGDVSYSVLRNQLVQLASNSNPPDDVATLLVNLQAARGLGIGVFNAHARFRSISISTVSI